MEAYEPLIQKYAKQYGIPEYVELIKAVMMQESGGRGLDPMQAAEGSFNTRYPHEPNGIQDPEYSIECGVQELKAALISAEVQNPIDMERINSLCRATILETAISHGQRATMAVIPMQMRWSSPTCRRHS